MYFAYFYPYLKHPSVKLHKHLRFGALVCSNINKQCSLCTNNYKGTLTIHYYILCNQWYNVLCKQHYSPSTFITVGNTGRVLVHRQVLWGPNHHYYWTPSYCTCMHAVKKGRRLENNKFFELKSRDIGMV